MSDVRAALATGCVACLDHMTACENSGLQWMEEPAIARSIVDRVLLDRAGQFSKNLEELVHTDDLGWVFPDLPGDRAHFSEPYLPLLLRGLVHAPPAYVVSMIAGNALGKPPAANIAGVILVLL